MSWLRSFLKHPLPPPPKVVPGCWKGHEPLIRWSRTEAYQTAHSWEGILALGATGAGKSSTLAAQLALAMIRSGYGGYVSTFKSSEAALWQSYGIRAGRPRSILLFGPAHPARFNFLDYELNRPGLGAGHTENLVHLFSTAVELARPPGALGRDGRDSGAFWELTKEQLLRNAIDLSILATGKVSITDLYRVIISAPHSLEEASSKSWAERSLCYKYLVQAEKRLPSPRDRQTYSLLVDYFLDEFATLSEKTRSIIVSSFTAMADLLNRGIGRELLGTDTNVTPEDLERGTILVPDLAIAEYGQIGRLIQGILRYSFQNGLQRREVVDGTRPVFFFGDEFQHFVTPSDQIFQTTCRSARIACVYLSQNIPNIVAALGGGTLGKAQCDSLLANLNHKVFFNNTCATTNEYASTLIGRTRQFLLNSSQSHMHSHWLDALTGGSGPPSTSAGMNETWEYEVQPSAFTTFRTGGHAHRGRVEAIVVRSGLAFRDTGRIWRLAQFQQQLSGHG